MNLNIIGYIIYLFITAIIIFRVGKICYDNGNIYVSQLIPDHIELCRNTNRVLLLGYYLLNLGYCATTLANWQKIISVSGLIEALASNTAIILGIIGLLHYLNIFIITNFIKKLIK